MYRYLLEKHYFNSSNKREPLIIEIHSPNFNIANILRVYFKIWLIFLQFELEIALNPIIFGLFPLYYAILGGPFL